MAKDNPSTQTGFFGAQLFDFSASNDVIVVNTSISLKYVEEIYASNVSEDAIWNYGSVIASALPSDENRIVFFTGQHDGELDGFLYFHTPGDASINGSYINLDKITIAPKIQNFQTGNFVTKATVSGLIMILLLAKV